MTSYVLDASAMLALLNQEPGYQIVEAHLSHGLMSAVNVSEVLCVLSQLGMTVQESSDMLSGLLNKMIPFDEAQAKIAAELRQPTKKWGLSLGDRACLGLAKSYQLPVLSADQAWAQLEIGVMVRLIR